MIMKKVASVLIAVLVLSVILTGCGGSSKVSSGKTEVLTVGYSSGDKPTDAEVKAMINEFNKTHKNVEVKAEPIAGNYDDVLKTHMASQTEPDIYSLDPQLIPSFVNAKQILPLDDYLKGYDLNDFEPNLLNQLKYQNVLYGLPTDYSTYALFYNKKLLKEAGVQPPKTWDELKAVAKKLTHGNVKGLALSDSFPNFQPFFYSNGGTMMQNGSPYINSKQNADALKFYVSLFKDGVASSPKQLGVASLGDALLQGTAAMAIDGTWTAGYIKQTDPSFQYGVVQIPISKKPASMTFIGAWAVSSHTKDKKAAVDFLKLIGSKQGIEAKVVQGSKTGVVLPSRISLSDQFLANNPDMKIFVDAVKYSSPYEYGMVSPIVIDQMNNVAQSLIIGKETDVQSLLDAAQKQLNQK